MVRTHLGLFSRKYAEPEIRGGAGWIRTTGTNGNFPAWKKSAGPFSAAFLCIRLQRTCSPSVRLLRQRQLKPCEPVFETVCERPLAKGKSVFEPDHRRVRQNRGDDIMPEASTSAGSPRPEELLERRLEHLERENRWWRGGLIAALVFIGLMILAAGHHHRRHIEVVVTVPPWALRRPYWGYGPGPYPPPAPGWGGGERPGPGMMMPGGGPNPPASQSPPR